MSSVNGQSSENPPMFDFSVLREIRKQSGLTLAELSERSGVSVAVISKLERNQTQAEVETLYKLGRVFGMRATDLLTLAESRLSNKKEAESYVSDGFTIRAVRYRNADCIMATAPAGARLSKPEIHLDDHEICWVLSGAIRLRVNQEIYDLKEGQSVQFDAIQEHSYEALEDCQLMIAHIRKAKRY